MTASRTVGFGNSALESRLACKGGVARRVTGYSRHDVKSMLRDVGLRPTRQRMVLSLLLFGEGDRHVTAEMLYEEATKAKVPVSLATVYNTLHQLTDVGAVAPSCRRRLENPISTLTYPAPPLLRRGGE